MDGQLSLIIFNFIIHLLFTRLKTLTMITYIIMDRLLMKHI